ncbi:MAG TPA: NAD(P)-dependent oxidoreductase [Dehalococcoidia bacterium]|nr:NAD(P)-dependent oxidoreductase [Dehalococcoidia bacterium]
MRIGFIGLGRMGNHMARNLAEKGHEVAAFDVVPAAVEMVAKNPGVRAATSVADAARDADVVCSSLPSPQSVEEIATGEGGLLEAMRPGTVYIDLSTNAPTVVRRLAPILAEKGIEMLDAPVSGGTGGAEAGTLSIMVGGDEAVYERMKPVLGAMGTKLFYCGSIGAGSVVKLCNNICGASYNVILGEALTLGVKAGVDLKTLATVIGSSTGTSHRLTMGFPITVFKHAFTPASFSAALSSKDTHLALDLAHELNVPVTMAEHLGEDLRETLARGWGDQSFDAVVQLQEERSGVDLRLKEEDFPLEFLPYGNTPWVAASNQPKA